MVPVVHVVVIDMDATMVVDVLSAMIVSYELYSYVLRKDISMDAAINAPLSKEISTLKHVLSNSNIFSLDVATLIFTTLLRYLLTNTIYSVVTRNEGIFEGKDIFLNIKYY